MNTYDLIMAALEAKSAYDQAVGAAQAAAAALSQAQSVLAAANQALHDDLAANGPAVIVDETSTPPAVTLYAAVDPDTYSATPLRVA